MSAENNRRLENLIRFGKIASVTPSNPFHTVTVNLGDIVTDELRLMNLRAGKDKTHDLPSVGDECILISPCGDLAQAVVLGYLNNQDNPTPSQDPNIKLRIFEDGAVISYDSANHSLQAILTDGGNATLTAPGGITLNGDTTINGNMQVNGNTSMTGNNTVGGSQSVAGTSQSRGTISSSADVTASGVSLKSHKHSGVQSGSSNSGGPN